MGQGVFMDLTGQTFGVYLQVLQRTVAPPKTNATMWDVLCLICKQVKSMSSDRIRQQKVASCGCAMRRVLSESRRRHGHCPASGASPELAAWHGMLQRCYDPTVRNYHRYGGRGITVCDTWRASFEFFLRDVGLRPSPAYSVERIDNNGPYAPHNVRWATAKEQARNRRSNRFITHNGETRTIAEWAEIVGIRQGTVAARLSRGWPVEKALDPRRYNPRGQVLNCKVM